MFRKFCEVRTCRFYICEWRNGQTDILTERLCTPTRDKVINTSMIVISKARTAAAKYNILHYYFTLQRQSNILPSQIQQSFLYSLSYSKTDLVN